MKIGNWPLLLLALEHAEKHPDEYNQSSWRGSYEGCGTTRCVAGWIAKFAGYTDISHDTVQVCVPGGDESDYSDWRYVDEAALTALELDLVDEDEPRNCRTLREELEDNLFDGSLSWSDVLTTVADLARADGVTPTPVLLAAMRREGVIDEHDDWVQR
jgi:hypothetical protein